MKDTVVVFARAPRLGTVKRRLAAEIGDRGALRFHQRTLLHLLRILHADRRFRTVLAITPDRARFQLSSLVPVLPQGRGDIGQRMHRACLRFPRGRIVVIGSDIPAANAADVAAAFRALGWAGAVFGPATDGGYWLVGLGTRRPCRPFAGARWSTSHALADTLANFGGRPVAMLRTLSDVDTAADWHRLSATGPTRSTNTARAGGRTRPAALVQSIQPEAKRRTIAIASGADQFAAPNTRPTS